MRPRSRKRKRTAGRRNADFSTVPEGRRPDKKAFQGTRSQPKGVPAQAQRSGLRGERTSNGVSEPCRLRRGEGYEVCEDEGGLFIRGLGKSSPTSRCECQYTRPACPFPAPVLPSPVPCRKKRDYLLSRTNEIGESDRLRIAEPEKPPVPISSIGGFTAAWMRQRIAAGFGRHPPVDAATAS